jgi:hypothetical protein
MMDLLKIMEALADRARREGPPSVDVSSRVVLRLRREVPRPAWPMVFVASSAAVAAAAVLILSFPSIEMLTDPWSAFFVIAANVVP